MSPEFQEFPFSRRQMLRYGMLAGGSVLIPGGQVFSWGDDDDDDDDDDDHGGGNNSGGGGTVSNGPAFSRPLVKPPVMQPTTLSPAPGSPDAQVGSQAVFHGIAPEHDPNHPDHAADWDREPELHYELTMSEGTNEFVEGVQTPIFGYNGTFPGPTFIHRQQQPAVVRVTNQLPCEGSVHAHGHHSPAHSDGYPDFYVLQNRTRDYYYPNIAPRRDASPANGGSTGPFDIGHFPSTLWYHDHAMDITGLNVSRGLAGFALFVDDLEQGLIDTGVLPETYGAQDIPIAIQDQKLNADGTLAYDFFDHNGRLGNIFTCNGRQQPYVEVERRKYRLRLLNASNARYYHVRMNSGTGEQLEETLPFLIIGKDSWLLPEAGTAMDFEMCPAERFDVIVDFTNAPDRMYLQNIMEQSNGRKPDGVDPDKEHTPLIEFRVVGEGPAVENDFTVTDGTPLRPEVLITPDEIVATRRFKFERRNGAWQINHLYFSPRRSDATVLRNSAERWIFENGGGGWWHPIHVHLEGQHIQSIDGVPREQLPFWDRGLIDTVNLEGGTEAEVFIKFRTFKGPYVFHCHIVEHEDMRMMAAFDPRDAGELSFLDGVTPHSEGLERQRISGMPIEPDEEDLCFETEAQSASGESIGPGDVDQLEGEGVGIPHSDFDPEGHQATPESPFQEDQLDD